MRDLTLVLPHFMNLGMLEEQQRIWTSYAPAVRRHLHVIVVDDCSPIEHQPTAASFTATGLASLRFYRLLEKKRWNWLACRNLGAREATTDWLLLTDIDHGVPQATMLRIMDGALDPATAYRFRRVTTDRVWPYTVTALPEYKPHNDSWLLTRELFFHDRVGGYDERLSGCYGTSAEFTDRVTAIAHARIQLGEFLVRYPREVLPDASTSPAVYTRKNDPENENELARRKAARKKLDAWRPLDGLVPWERVL